MPGGLPKMQPEAPVIPARDTLRVMELTEWIEGYRKAWESGRHRLVLTLFTEDASYRSNPFEEPHLGHEGIRAYWDRVTSQQRDAR